MEIFAGAAMALYAAHHVGDYWVQTDHQARHKGDAGAGGRLQCLAHVLTYLLTQQAFLIVLAAVTGWHPDAWQLAAAMAISGVTHYAADRREHGLMYWLARRAPGKAAFLELGRPRPPRPLELWGPCSTCEGRGTSYDESTGGKCWDCRGTGQYPGVVELEDAPQLATGAWALDQAWHIFWGVFVAALVLSL
jgi:hypothetical protein